MKLNKKLFLALSLAVCTTAATAAAAAPSSPLDAAVFATGNVKLTGSGHIVGDLMMTGGTLTMDGGSYITGTAYLASNVGTDIKKNIALNQEEYTNPATLDLYNDITLPDNAVFDGSQYSDGMQDIVATYWNSAIQAADMNKVISENTYVNKLDLSASGSSLTFNVPEDKMLIVRANSVDIKGTVKIEGGGQVIIYVNDLKSFGGNGILNSDGNADQLIFVYPGTGTLTLDNCTDVKANFISNGPVTMNNFTLKGNVYTTGDFKYTNSGTMSGFVYAPAGASSIAGGTSLTGTLITKTISLSGGVFVTKGPTDGFITGALWDNIKTGFVNQPVEDPDPIEIPQGALEVIEHDVAAHTYTHGYMYTKMHSPVGHNDLVYTVLDETSFVADTTAVPQNSIEKIDTITDKTNYIFDYRKNDVSLTPFGRVDSNAYTYALTIAPFVVPLLEQDGITPNMWLAWGDTNGNVTKTWMTVE